MEKDVPPQGNVFEKCIPTRYILAILGSIGLAIIHGLKTNISVRPVAMVNIMSVAIVFWEQEDANKKMNEECGLSSVEKKEEFTIASRGCILSSYLWGYLISQIPGGRLAETFSAKWIFLYAVITNVVCTLLTPIVAKLNIKAVVGLRTLEGIGAGATLPAMYVLLAAWSPPQERGIMSSIIYSGTVFGRLISSSMAGQLSANFGPDSVFYIMGFLCIPWIVLWAILIKDAPSKEQFVGVSVTEREYIVQQVAGSSELASRPLSLLWRTVVAQTPWKTILTSAPWTAILSSGPFWSLIIAHTCSSWGWYIFLTQLPRYLEHFIKITPEEMSIISIVPYFTLCIFSLIVSYTLDTLISKSKISTTRARKIANSIGSIGPSVCLLGMYVITSNRPVAMTLVTVGLTFAGVQFCGILINHIDVAPNHAGTLLGLTNTCGTLSGMAVPYFINAMTDKGDTIEAWRRIFSTTIGAYAIVFIAYTILGTGEEQPWNKSKKTAENPEVTLNAEV